MFKKIATCFVVLILLGAGCKTNTEKTLDDIKIRKALEKMANKLEWSSTIIAKGPPDKNHYGNSLIVFGPHKNEVGQFLKSTVEIIKLETYLHAERAYQTEKCFEGQGQPIKIFNITACCLNRKTEKESEVIMKYDNYILKSYDYLHADCKARDALEIFWQFY